MNSDRRQSAPMAALDDIFAEARQAEAVLPVALMARVMADAARLQPQPVAPRPQPRASWRTALAALFGGGFSVAGLVAAGVAGVWIGFVQPFDLGLGLQAGTLETLELFPADLEQWTETLAPDLLAED